MKKDTYEIEIWYESKEPIKGRFYYSKYKAYAVDKAEALKRAETVALWIRNDLKPVLKIKRIQEV